MESLLTCKVCNHKFNNTNKSPIVVQCGHSCCKECYLKQINLETGLLTCPLDDKTFKIPTDLAYNQVVLEMLKMSPKGPQITCSDHDKEVEFYC